MDLVDYSKRVKSADMTPDIQETMASIKRIAALESKLPRSPEHVFADLEQDHGAATGINRSFALPELELLPLQGQAVHDGTRAEF